MIRAGRRGDVVDCRDRHGIGLNVGCQNAMLVTQRTLGNDQQRVCPQSAKPRLCRRLLLLRAKTEVTLLRSFETALESDEMVTLLFLSTAFDMV